MLTRLARWIRPASDTETSHLRVTVYTREGCCCCHKALDLLNEYRRVHRFQIAEVDVDSDPGLAAKYGLDVPVVTVDDKVRFKGVVNPVLLARLLKAEGRPG